MHEKKLKKNSNRIDVPKKEIYIKITIRKKKNRHQAKPSDREQ